MTNEQYAGANVILHRNMSVISGVIDKCTLTKLEENIWLSQMSQKGTIKRKPQYFFPSIFYFI